MAEAMTSATSLSYKDFVDEILEARTAYGKAIVEVGDSNPRAVVLTADVMRSTKLGDFAQKYPERFFNVGIAEQTMISAAAGLALTGDMPIATTFATFVSMRAYEQIRTDICYMNLNVKVVGTHSAFCLGGGTTHNALEDIAIMRNMPNMTVEVPADPRMVATAVKKIAEFEGPCYLRIGRGADPILYPEDQAYEIGRAIVAAEGKDATIIACGTCVGTALKVADKMKEKGIGVRVLDMHTVAPLDEGAIITAAKETGRIVTVEDGYITNGMGSGIADLLLEGGYSPKFKRLGMPAKFAVFGGQDDLHAYYGYDEAGVEKAVHAML